MKAQTLSICIPGQQCDKDCPYCVSKMTWYPPKDEHSWLVNRDKVVNFARMAQVTDVIITGKGEPSLRTGFLMSVLTTFAGWPLVLQTNGRFLSGHPEKIQVLSDHGLNVLAVSIDDPKQMNEYKDLWDVVKWHPPLTARVTVMVTPEVCQVPFLDWVDMSLDRGIRGLSFRQITVPEECADTPEAKQTAEWIRSIQHTPAVLNWTRNFEWEFKESERDKDHPSITYHHDKKLVRKLPYGAVIKDFKGVSVTKFDYCIQDTCGDDDIRSLIYNQDGHLYTSWSSPASMIF